MADEQPAPATPVKVCPGCGHEVGQEHEKRCYYKGVVVDAVAV